MATTDRERLEKMSKQFEEHRAQEAIAMQQEQAVRLQAEKDKIADARQKTAELRKYCEETFKGFKLNPTGHEVSVDTASSSRLNNITSDGHDYVMLHISHFGDETGNFQGQIPILLCRYHIGMYEVAVAGSSKVQHAPNLDPFKDYLLRAVGGMGRQAVGELFQQVKTQLKR